MAVESTEGGITITGEHIQAFQLTRVAYALAIEVNTGLKVGRGGSLMTLAASYCGSSKRTKRGVLKDYVAFLTASLPQTARGPWQPSPSIRKALGQ